MYKTDINKDKFLYNIFYSILVGIFVIFILSSIGFIIKVPINKGYFFIGMTACFVTNYIFGLKDKLNLKQNIFSGVILLLVCLCSYFAAQFFIDASYDGREYHQTGIIFLKNGFNPIYNTAQEFFNQNYSFPYNVPVWVDSYPKFTEIFAANIFCITDNIEGGKVINIITAFLVLCYSYYILRKYYNSKFNFVFSLLFTLNPIAIVQMLTYYNDGLLYYFFAICLLSIIDISKNQNSEIRPYIILGMGLIILSNIKLGGLVMSLFLIIFALLILRKEKIKLKVLNISILASVCLILITGINPYFTNINRGKHILYPLAGKEKIDIITKNIPTPLINKPMPVKLFISTFVELNNNPYDYNNFCRIKIPFTFNIEEIFRETAIDLRLGGFGIFWSGIIILSLISCFWIKKDRGIILFLLFTVLINPNNWWARYVPQFYLIPVFIALSLLNINKKRVLALVLLFCLTLNSIQYFMVNAFVSAFVVNTKSNINKTLQKTDVIFLISDIEKLKKIK